jgi:heme exporter protein B
MIGLILRDVRHEWASGAFWLPVAFFLLVATLFPFAIGPDAALLRQTGAGTMWIAALLAALLPIERLFTPDMERGVIDQLAIRGFAEESVVTARLASHLASFGIPLMLASLPASALLGLDPAMLARLLTSLAIGLPGLAALSIMVAAITVSTRGGSALAGLMALPLAVPLLIFGVGMLSPAGAGAIYYLAALSLFLVAISPFVAAAALRAARES